MILGSLQQIYCVIPLLDLIEEKCLPYLFYKYLNFTSACIYIYIYLKMDGNQSLKFVCSININHQQLLTQTLRGMWNWRTVQQWNYDGLIFFSWLVLKINKD